jgi:hypothetical protein
MDLLNPASFLMAGQTLSLQLNSSAIASDFASLAASSTGWRVQLVRPDNSTADLGLMTNWEVWSSAIYKWNMTMPGSYFQQVSAMLL